MHWEVIGQFHCKLLLSLEIAKAEAIVVSRPNRTENEWVYSYMIQVYLK